MANCVTASINSEYSSDKKDLIKKAVFNRWTEEEQEGKTYADVTDADLQEQLCGVVCNWVKAIEHKDHDDSLSLTDMTTT